MHPLIVLWSHPRSMSTAFERTMRERGDFRCHHEPFLYHYYVAGRRRPFAHFDLDPEQPVRYEDIRAMLLAEAARWPVFVKDMSYYVLEPMRADEAFARRITNTFLIRDPARAIVSYQRLDPDFECEELGLEAQWHHYRWLRDVLGLSPVVVDASDLRAAPSAVMQAWCAATGIADRPEALAWDRDPPADWAAVAAWHDTVSQTSTIRCEPEAPIETLQARIDANPRLAAIHAHHLPFYERLRAMRLRTS